MGAKFFRESGILRATADRGNSVSEFVGKLNSEMPKAADALHRNEVAGRRATVTQ